MGVSSVSVAGVMAPQLDGSVTCTARGADCVVASHHRLRGKPLTPTGAVNDLLDMRAVLETYSSHTLKRWS